MTISKFIKKLSMTFAGTALIAFGGTTVAQAISIVPNNDGEALVNEILGSGIKIVQNSIKYTGAPGASGFFTDGSGSDGIGIDNGIILTTGAAVKAEGPNHFDRESTPNGFPGDPDLDGLITNTGFTTQDATILEFDFETQGGDVFFNYIFASEEYNEFVNTKFNDVFGFFLNGENIALVPGTNTPVAINTVNGGYPLGTEASNSEYFNNNDKDDGGPFFNIEYNGFTNVLTAQALGLDPGYHTLKLAIGDVGDQGFDSAVLIQAKSLSAQATLPEVDQETLPEAAQDVPEPSVVMGLLAVGFAGSLLKKKSTNSNN